jgi:hypothetical protein
MLRARRACECPIFHDGTKIPQLMEFHIGFSFYQSRKTLRYLPLCDCEQDKEERRDTVRKCRLGSSSTGHEIRIASCCFGCTSAHSSGLPLFQNGNPEDTDAFVIRGHRNQTVMATDPEAAKCEKAGFPPYEGAAQRPARARPAFSLFEGLLQFFTGAPQFFRMKRLSARLLYSVMQEFLTKVN